MQLNVSVLSKLFYQEIRVNLCFICIKYEEQT